MEYSELIRCRYSCRSFSQAPVEPEKIDKIIKAGILAPTAKNLQPFRIFRMDSPEAKENIRSATRCHFGADNFLVIGAVHTECYQRSYDGFPFADVDAAIAVTHMLLEIHNLGLGSTWVGYFDANKLKAAYPQMQDLDLVAILPIGYPAENAEPAPRHNIRREEAELVISL